MGIHIYFNKSKKNAVTPTPSEIPVTAPDKLRGREVKTNEASVVPVALAAVFLGTLINRVENPNLRLVLASFSGYGALFQRQDYFKNLSQKISWETASGKGELALELDGGNLICFLDQGKGNRREGVFRLQTFFQMLALTIFANSALRGDYRMLVPIFLPDTIASFGATQVMAKMIA